MSLRGRLAKNLRRLRHAQGLSQEELGDRAEISGNYVGQLEREEKAASIDVLERLAGVLGVDATDLLRRE
jgi:transcriptional regulator with XRE-family HTH domain